MAEDSFVGTALELAQTILKAPLSVERGAAILYQVNVDSSLNFTSDPRSPTRGQSAFETDLCVFDETSEGTKVPRVVFVQPGT